MFLLVAALVFLRLLLWHIYPKIGIGHYSDIAFGTACLTTLVVYGLVKARNIFFAPLILLTLVIAATTYHRGFYDLDIKYLLTFDIYMLVVLAVQGIKHLREIRLLLGCLIGYALLSAISGVWQIAVVHLHRAPGLQGWPLSLAGQLLLFMPWALSRLTIRSGVICLGFVSALSVLPAISLIILYLRNRWVLLISFCLLIPAAYFKNIIGAWDVRIGYYQHALELLAKSPVLGAGTGRYVYSKISPTSFVHNSYLQIWIEQGCLGFIAIVWLVVMIFKNPIELRWVWLGLCVFLIDNVFSYTLIKANTSFLFWVMFAVYVNLYTKENARS